MSWIQLKLEYQVAKVFSSVDNFLFLSATEDCHSILRVQVVTVQFNRYFRDADGHHLRDNVKYTSDSGTVSNTGVVFSRYILLILCVLCF